MSRKNESRHMWRSHSVMSHRLHFIAKDESCRTWMFHVTYESVIESCHMYSTAKDWSCRIWMSHVTLKLVIESCHTGSRTDFRTIFPKLFSWTSFQERDFKFCFTWYPTDNTLCLWSGFTYPRVRLFDTRTFSVSLFQKEAFEISFLENRSWNEAEVKILRRAKLSRGDYLNYLKNEAKSGDWPFLKSDIEIYLRENGRKSVLLPASRRLHSTAKDESCRIWMFHVTYEWVIESCRTGCILWRKMGHVANERVTWRLNEPLCHVTQAEFYNEGWVMSHINESRHVWRSHWVMSHRLHSMAKDESCRIWMRNVTFDWVIE